MNPDTVTWIAQTPVEALLCRDLRHCWPRPAAAGTGKRRYDDGIPPSSPGIRWQVVSSGATTGPRVLERTMSCDAGCGVRRREIFVVRDERLVRAGAPHLIYPAWYRRRRTEPDRPLESLDSDVLRGSIVARLYPGLTW